MTDKPNDDKAGKKCGTCKRPMCKTLTVGLHGQQAHYETTCHNACHPAEPTEGEKGKFENNGERVSASSIFGKCLYPDYCNRERDGHHVNCRPPAPTEAEGVGEAKEYDDVVKKMYAAFYETEYETSDGIQVGEPYLVLKHNFEDEAIFQHEVSEFVLKEIAAERRRGEARVERILEAVADYKIDPEDWLDYGTLSKYEVGRRAQDQLVEAARAAAGEDPA